MWVFIISTTGFEVGLECAPYAFLPPQHEGSHANGNIAIPTKHQYPLLIDCAFFVLSYTQFSVHLVSHKKVTTFINTRRVW